MGAPAFLPILAWKSIGCFLGQEVLVALILARGNSVVAIMAWTLENRQKKLSAGRKQVSRIKGQQETQAASLAWGTEVGRRFCRSGVGLRFVTHEDGALFSLKALPHCLKAFPMV